MNALQKTGEEGQRERVETGCQASAQQRSARDGDVDPAPREDPSRTRLSDPGGRLANGAS
jgi:hypothetical protein